MRRVPCPLLGREVELPRRPRRIVSLSPSLTDTVWALGLGGRMAGRSAWCRRPREAKRLPVVGHYLDVREERLAALEPDLILAVSGVQEPAVRRLAAAGWPVYLVPLPTSPWAIVDGVTLVAGACGEPERGVRLAGELTRALAAVEGVLPPLVTYAELDLGGPITVGLGAHVTWCLAWLGLRPVGMEEPRAYLEPDRGWLQTLRPELVVLDPQPGRAPTPEVAWVGLERRGLGSWRSTARLVVTEGDVLAHPGPWLLTQGLAELVRAVAR